jgi:hypothetical protein
VTRMYLPCATPSRLLSLVRVESVSIACIPLARLLISQGPKPVTGLIKGPHKLSAQALLLG